MKVPLKRTLTMICAAVALDATLQTIIGKAPFAGTVTSVEYIPLAAITGANTDTRKVSVHNRGSAGLGTTEIASKEFDAGFNGVAFDAKALDLNGTAANLQVNAGDVITFDSETIGTGIADPGGTVIIELTRS